MKIVQYCWAAAEAWDRQPSTFDIGNAALILVFGSTEIITRSQCLAELQQAFPDARMIGCSSAGEILGTTVSDNRLIATVVSFTSTRVTGACVCIHDFTSSDAAAQALARQFPQQGLRHLFVLADGLLTNGSEIVRGLSEVLPADIPITGGLAGDGMKFGSSYTIFNGVAQQASLTAVGLYGEKLRIGYGSSGGWIPFGPERLITASTGNTLYELDGHSALALYKEYLGKDADQLPAAGLNFPLSIQASETDTPAVRTIMNVDEEHSSLSFAGDVPTGSYARFMRAAPDDLIDGAATAADISKGVGGDTPELCILISCAGRRAILKQLAEEETEIVAERFSNNPAMTGFYSYGEIAPFNPGLRAILHNQTMTITTISED